jgi:hypothetical protein
MPVDVGQNALQIKHIRNEAEIQSAFAGSSAIEARPYRTARTLAPILENGVFEIVIPADDRIHYRRDLPDWRLPVTGSDSNFMTETGKAAVVRLTLLYYRQGMNSPSRRDKRRVP